MYCVIILQIEHMFLWRLHNMMSCILCKREALIILDLKDHNSREKTEQLREELYNIIGRKGINSPEAICASQELDEKVNEYYRLEGCYIKI